VGSVLGWGRRGVGCAVLGALVLAAVPPAEAAFELEALSPAERGAATAMALGLLPGSLATRSAGPADATGRPMLEAYGFKPFGLGELDFASVSVAFPVRGPVRWAGISYARLAGLSYCEEVWAVSAALGRGRTVIEPKLRLGTVRLDGALEDWAIAADLGAETRLARALSLAVTAENPLALGLAREHGGVPRRLRLGLGMRAGEGLGFGFEVVKEPRFALATRSGIEWRPGFGLSVRAGIRTSPAELAFGVGLRRGWIAIDIASAFNFELGTTHEAGLTLMWK
jgi:hypothetical protein